MTHGHPVPNQSLPLQGSECPGDKQELLWHSLGQGDRPGTAVREGRAGSPPSHAAVKLGALRCLCRCPRNTEYPSLHITRLGGEGLMPRTASQSSRLGEGSKSLSSGAGQAGGSTCPQTRCHCGSTSRVRSLAAANVPQRPCPAASH